MIRHKHTPFAKQFHLTDKERQRASEDDMTVIVRPQSDGTWQVFAVSVETCLPTPYSYTVDYQSELPEATQLMCRDLDKFLGRGGKMSSSGRTRRK